MCLEEKNVILRPDNGIIRVWAEGNRIGVYFQAVSSLKLDDWVAIKYGQQNIKVPGGEKDVPPLVVQLINSFNDNGK